MLGLRSTYCLILFLLISLLVYGQSTDNEDPASIGSTVSAIDLDAQRHRITEEAPSELVNIDIGDSSVSLLLSGRWKGTLQGSLGMAFTSFGTESLSSETPFFTQEGDLTLSLWIIDRWFVEASFIEDSTLNTYRAGYQGKEGEELRAFLSAVIPSHFFSRNTIYTQYCVNPEVLKKFSGYTMRKSADPEG